MFMNEIYNILKRIDNQLPCKFDITIDSEFVDGCIYYARDGYVFIKGKDKSFICRGIYHYLRKYCNLNFTWTLQKADVPPVLPDAEPTVVNTPYKHRLYMNMCTFGYSSVWWDWQRWEREIEWMALRGINMPLAMCGQEAIWMDLWKEFGIEYEQLNDYFTGPAYLPWNRCGNLNGFDGPLPKDWIESQRSLQKKIIAKMKSLDIVPIVPAFSGYIPNAFSEIYPEEKTCQSNQWAQFEDKYRSRLLSIESPLFTKISERFIKLYEAEYGSQKYFLADVFHENSPVNISGDVGNQLAEYGAIIHNGIKAGNPDGVWVLQGWSFYFDDVFWTKANVEALLSRVATDDVVIIDLCNERFSGWQKFNSYYGRNWIYSFVHNFGGNDLLNGDLRFFARHTADMLRVNPNVAGFGFSPEGIENNEVVYELLSDLAWSKQEISIDNWLREYSSNRYGKDDERLFQAWKILLQGAYSANNTNIKHGFQSRPSLQLTSHLDSASGVREVSEIFVGLIDGNTDVGLIYDTIEVLAQYCGIVCDKGLQLACNCLNDGSYEKGQGVADSVFVLLYEIDLLMSYIPGRSLDRWCKSAQSFAIDDEQKEYYRKNAKRLLSVWGGPILADYAARMWSGLIYRYYAARWQAFFHSLVHNECFDSERWELDWIEKNSKSEQAGSDFDVVKSLRKVLNLIVELDESLREENILCQSLKAGRWICDDYASVEIDVSQALVYSGQYLLKIEQDPGMDKPEVEDVKLYVNNRFDSESVCIGNNNYKIDLYDRKPGASYSLVVKFGDCKNREIFGDLWISCVDIKSLVYNESNESLNVGSH